MTATPARVLVIEDEPQLAALLRDYLEKAGFGVDSLGDGNAAAEFVRRQGPDIVLLDIMLPGKDGLAVCREIRTSSAVPVIMVTARVEEIDRLLGLELGADDYICKPFSPREVVARVKAVLRRSASGQAPRHAALELDEQRYRATIDGHGMDLTAVEFQLLRMLASEPGRIFSRNQLMDGIYRDHRVVSDRTIDSHVKKLRRKLDGAGPGHDLIQSVYGIGYKFEPPPVGD